MGDAEDPIKDMVKSIAHAIQAARGEEGVPYKDLEAVFGEFVEVIRRCKNVTSVLRGELLVDHRDGQVVFLPIPPSERQAYRLDHALLMTRPADN